MNSVRRFSRRCWLLHAWLLSQLVFLPVPIPVTYAEDDPPPEENWSFVRSESATNLYVSCDAGTFSLQPEEEREISVRMESMTWEVWESDQGNTDIRNSESSPCTGVEIALSVIQGSGSVTGGGTTDQYGYTSATFTMGPANGNWGVNRVRAATDSIETHIDFHPGPENWAFSHQEATLSAVVSPTDELPAELPAGYSGQLRVQGTYSTWDVYVSNWGGRDFRYVSTTPASGAAVQWSVQTPGDAVLSGALSTQLNELGEAVVDFTMGGSNSRIKVGMEYGGSEGIEGSYDLVAVVIADTFVFDRAEGYLTVSMGAASGSTSDLVLNQDYPAFVDVSYTSWEVWKNSLGEESVRHHSQGPAINAPVVLSVLSGGLRRLPTSPGYTDQNGRLNFQYAVLESDSTLKAEVEYASTSAWSSLALSLETWAQSGSGSQLVVSLNSDGTAAGQTLTASVSQESWETWTSSAGRTETRNSSSSQADGAALSFSISSGDATLSSAGTTTASDGTGTVFFLAGTLPSDVYLSASFNGMAGETTFNLTIIDTDGDGYSNQDEVEAGSDPNEARDWPGHPYVALGASWEPIPDGEVDVPYLASPAPAIHGGTPPYTVTKTGPMYDAWGGTVEWTPDAAGSYAITVSVTDADGEPLTTIGTVTVLPPAPTVVSGGGVFFEPSGTEMSLSVSVTRRGAPLVGVPVSFSHGASEVTDQTGAATATVEMDGSDQTITATAAGETVIFYLLSYTPWGPGGTDTINVGGGAWINGQSHTQPNGAPYPGFHLMSSGSNSNFIIPSKPDISSKHWFLDDVNTIKSQEQFCKPKSAN